MSLPKRAVDNAAATFYEEECPLFMEGLPSDFSSNSGLAALASLLKDDNTQSGGGKVPNKAKKLNRLQRREKPYSVNTKTTGTKQKTETTTAEAQLFLKMWKL
jgi:hypothetical protein